MRKGVIVGIVALLLVGLVASAFAFSGKGLGNDAPREALKNGDYGAWKNAIVSGLTEERFNQLRERESLSEQNRVQMDERRMRIEESMEQGYDAWKAAVANSPREMKMAEKITQENFDAFVQMHKALQSGDTETAKKLAEELGLSGFRGGGHRGFPKW
ncbi:hypothetical protein JXA85_04480 [Candidatus Woesearchaeota archaeon]|nr:hypothetical protein [Candidatus Woesearchaeota archaeon]